MLVFSHSPHDSLIDKKNSLALPPPILPLTRLHALFIGVFKSHIGLAWIVRCLKRGALSISLQRTSPLPGPRPLGFYACVPGCESECTLSQVDRAFIHSTLKVCRWLAAIAITVSASVCLLLSLFCSLSHLSACDVSMRNKQPRLWPFDRQTVGNKTSENRRRRRRKRNKSEWCPRRVNSVAGAASLRIAQRWA